MSSQIKRIGFDPKGGFMNQEINVNNQAAPRENVVAGIVGAFLFSLAGGVLWFVIYMVGFVAAISGLVGVICAIKGYALFAKKESIKGIIISSVIALGVIVLAWYFSIGYEIYNSYQELFMAGESDFTVTFFESMRLIPTFFDIPEVRSACLRDLLLGLVFCIVASVSYIINKIRSAKAANVAANVPFNAPVNEAQDQNNDTNA